MSQINDAIVAAVGPHINDGLLAYYKANGATANQINDAEYQFLIANGADPAQLNDMWFRFLRLIGYKGALDDMLLDFWEGGGVIPVPGRAFDNGFDTGFG